MTIIRPLTPTFGLGQTSIALQILVHWWQMTACWNCFTEAFFAILQGAETNIKNNYLLRANRQYCASRIIRFTYVNRIWWPMTASRVHEPWRSHSIPLEIMHGHPSLAPCPLIASGGPGKASVWWVRQQGAILRHSSRLSRQCDACRCRPSWSPMTPPSGSPWAMEMVKPKAETISTWPKLKPMPLISIRPI